MARTLPGMTDTSAAARSARTLLNKVPEVTVCFWVIKILATTVGETAADFLATNLGLGLGGTTLMMSLPFLVVLGSSSAPRATSPASTGSPSC